MALGLGRGPASSVARRCLGPHCAGRGDGPSLCCLVGRGARGTYLVRQDLNFKFYLLSPFSLDLTTWLGGHVGRCSVEDPCSAGGRWAAHGHHLGPVGVDSQPLPHPVRTVTQEPAPACK